MCTIVAIRDVRPDVPLVLATNRDEFYARPSTGAVRLLQTPPTVGGRDLVAGGTWMGVTQRGLFVGVTNQRGAQRDPSKRSRGELVLHALSLADGDAIARYVASLDGRAYSGFNLMWGDASSLHVAYGREDRREIELASVPPGIHVLPNDRLDSPSFAKVARVQTLLAPHLAAPLPAFVEALKNTLADRALPAQVPDVDPRMDPEFVRQLAALCVRTPDYGTRSASVVLLGPGRVQGYWVSDGPPDRSAFVDVSGLFA